MTRLRWLLALPAILLATSGPSMAAEVRDKAGLFSADAVRKAQSELDRIEREYSVPVTIEAIPSLNGEEINDVTARHAESVGAKGIYILIPKADHKIRSLASRGYQKYLSRARLQAIDDAFVPGFKKGDFDGGLSQGVSKIDSTLSEARTEAGGSLRPAPVAAGPRAAQAPVPIGRPRAAGNNSSWGIGSLFMLVIGILAIFLVIRVLGALFSAARGGYANQGRMGGPGGYGPGGPGYGAPGYGGGGGGFMSSMLGGIGGALAGNWLYDQFSGRHHGVDQASTYDPASGAAPAPDAGPEWGEGGAGHGGGDAGGGGDWGGGGGGGGDWGGGGGGGDWGGGGGGDWGGGGGDDGGSW